MPQTPTTPFSYKRFQIWRLRQPLGKELPIEYVLIVSKVDTPRFYHETSITVIPLYHAGFYEAVRGLSNNITFAFIRGGEGTLSGLNYDVFIGTDAIFTTQRSNLASYVNTLRDDLQLTVCEQLKERLSL